MTGPRQVPDVDHLTRDYRGLREQLIELVTRSGSPWTERSAADVGMVVLEAAAYMLDHLAYAGDRAAAEGFLRTARARQSARLHAALGDYTLDRGATSEGHQHFAALAGELRLPALFRVGPRLAPGQDPDDRDTFETLEPATISARHNGFTLRQSVGAGSTLLWLGGPRSEPLDLWAAGLRPGMRLALVARDDAEIVLIAGVQGGAVLLAHPCRATHIAGSADRASRVLGNLVAVRRGRRGEWRLLARGGATRDELPLAVYFRRRLAQLQALAERVEAQRPAWIDRPELAHAWHVAQRNAALAVCRLRTVASEALSAALEQRLDDLLVEAADGLRGALQALGLSVPAELRASRHVTLPRQRVALPPEEPPLWLDGRLTLEVTTLVGARTVVWTEVDDLLRSGPDDPHYVVEVAHERDVALRFGDGRRGAMPAPGAAIMARWVTGDPALGDVGRDALTRVLGAQDDRLDPLAPTRNPLATAGARPPEPLERVADRLRLRLAAPAIPVTRGDYIELLEQRPDVVEAAVLPVVGSLVRVVVRLADDADIAASVPALRRWLAATRLAGTRVRLSLARPLHVSVTAAVQVHPEAEPEAVQARCRAELRALFRDRPRQLGAPCTASDVLRALESVNGVEWSELHRFDRAGDRPPVVRDVVAPAPDQALRCLDLADVAATGQLAILVVREYGLRVELRHSDPDLVPPQDELYAALHAALSGPAAIPFRARWPVVSLAALRELLTAPPFTGPNHALHPIALTRGDRSVDHFLLGADVLPTLRNLQLVLRRTGEPGV